MPRGSSNTTAIDPSAPETAALEQFLARLAPGAHILDIGCGPGTHALMMQGQGFEVTAGTPRRNSWSGRGRGSTLISAPSPS
jgi:cyclopropane fatty-acyl-phospholipid synthase-like methyltransferase